MTRLSYSRLSRFETCPLSYKLHYLDQREAGDSVPLAFGSAVHAALEHLVREHLAEERVGPLCAERAASLWQSAWTESGLIGLPLFREGLALVHRFVREQGVLDHLDVLAARVMGCDESRNAQGRCRELRAAWIGSRLVALCGRFSDARPRQAS